MSTSQATGMPRVARREFTKHGSKPNSSGKAGQHLSAKATYLRAPSGPTLVPGYRFQGRGRPAGATGDAARGPNSDASGMVAVPECYYMKKK